LEAGRSEEAEVSTKAAIEKDPNNAVLYSVLGSLYDAKANPKDGKALSEAEMMKWYDLAESAYKSSIEKDPKLFDSYFNIGVLYNNRAAFIYDKIADIKDDTKYNAAQKDADAIYLKAVPYFEKAHELRPDDTPTMQQLKKLYAKTGETAKYEAMKKLLGE
jgi:tetratricopeptide (TPR) repeat protein